MISTKTFQYNLSNHKFLSLDLKHCTIEWWLLHQTCVTFRSQWILCGHTVSLYFKKCKKPYYFLITLYERFIHIQHSAISLYKNVYGNYFTSLAYGPELTDRLSVSHGHSLDSRVLIRETLPPIITWHSIPLDNLGCSLGDMTLH